MRRTRERIQGNLRMFTPHTIDEEDVFVLFALLLIKANEIVRAGCIKLLTTF
jgi:hypothetical protein